MTDTIYQLAVQKLLAEEMKLKGKEMEVLVEKQNAINYKLRTILDADVESVITEEGTIEIDDVAFTLDYVGENDEFILKAEIVCCKCGEILYYKTIYGVKDIADVYEKHPVCFHCIEKAAAERDASFWDKLKRFFHIH